MGLFGMFRPRARRDEELREEIRTHLAMAVQDRIARGEDPVEAEHAARREFGNEALIREVTREIWGGAWLERVAQDARYAVRGLARSPGLTTAVVLTLALGLGANLSVFSFLDRLFLREAGGVVRPEQVRRLYQTARDMLGQPMAIPLFNFPTVRLVQGAGDRSAGLSAYRLDPQVALGHGDDAPRVAAVWAGDHYFDVLGVRPERGRFFSADETAMGSGARVAVVSDAFWRTRLGGDPSVLGRAIELDKERYVVVGVTPPGFRGTDVDAADVWLPLSAMPGPTFTVAGRPVPWYEQHGTLSLSVIARPRAGSDLRPAIEAATAAVRASNRSLGSADSTTTLFTGPLIAARGPGKRSEAIGMAARLAAVALIVLLIACANVANLLLARALRRRREIAVRLALGVSRRRLMMQLVTESLVLALLAGGGALLVGFWGGHALRAMLMPDTHWAGPVLGAHAVLAIVLAALGCGVATGLVPAMQATRPELTGALKGGTRDGTYQPSRVRDGLIVLQTALSVVLLVGAGLFLRSLREVERADIGYDADRLVFAGASWDDPGQRAAQGDAALKRAAERLRHVPGVESVALASVAPMRGFSITDVLVPGRDSLPTAQYGYPTYRAVSPEFFAATGLRVLRGRGFVAREGESGAPVVVVNRVMAHALWPGEDAVGECIQLHDRTAPCATVVGVVEDGRHADIVEPEAMQFYVPLGGGAPDGTGLAGVLIIRTPPERSGPVAAAAERTLRETMPGAEPRVQRMAELLAPQFRPWRLGAGLLSALGLLALLVAALGTYSALAYVFSQRRHEIGIRLALGARTSSIFGLVVGEGVRLVVIGVVVGSLLALAAGRLVASALYATSPRDPAVMGAAAVVLLAMAVAASLAPAWRAATVDPAGNLRAE